MVYYTGQLIENVIQSTSHTILGDPGADSGGEAKSKRAEK